MSDQVGTGATASAAQASVTPTAPKGVEDEALGALQAQAQELARQVTESSGDRELGRKVGSLGSEQQRNAGRQIELLKTKVGTLLDDLDGPGSEIPKGLIKLRETMDEINPNVVGSKPQGFFSKLLRKTPAIGDTLAAIAVKYESVQTQIDVIIGSLRHGKDELLPDSIELERLYREVQAAQVEVQKAAYMGELVWKEFEQALPDVADPAERQRLETLIHRLAMRVQDLRTMEQVNTQFFISIDMTIQNNDHLSDAIDRTLTVTQSLLTVGLAIQAALANQKKILGAVQETQKYTSDMLAANAAAIRQQTTEVGDLYKNPVLALDKVKSAYDDLMASMDEMERIRKEGTESARSGIEQLTSMTRELDPKAEGLREARDFELPSGDRGSA